MLLHPLFTCLAYCQRRCLPLCGLHPSPACARALLVLFLKRAALEGSDFGAVLSEVLLTALEDGCDASLWLEGEDTLCALSDIPIS